MLFFVSTNDHLFKKIFCLIIYLFLAHFLPGILLLVQPSVGCEVVLAIILITLSLGFNGACTITNVQNNQDLAPNFAGSLYGIINCVGSSTGFITPILAGYITQDNVRTAFVFRILCL